MTSKQYPEANAQEHAASVVKVSSVPPVSLGPGIDTKIVCGKGLTLSFASIAPGAMGPVHSHPHEQMIYVLEGEGDVIIEGKSYHVKAGEAVSIPGNVEHTGGARDMGCRFLEIFTPARADFEQKLAAAKAERQ